MTKPDLNPTLQRVELNNTNREELDKENRKKLEAKIAEIETALGFEVKYIAPDGEIQLEGDSLVDSSDEALSVSLKRYKKELAGLIESAGGWIPEDLTKVPTSKIDDGLGDSEMVA